MRICSRLIAHFSALTVLVPFARPLAAQTGAVINEPQTPRARQTLGATMSAEEWRADLRYMSAQLRTTHKNLFHAVSEATFDSAVASLDARIPSLRREQIVVAMARIVAMVGDGHTNIYPTRDAQVGFHAFPVSLYSFRDGLFVRAARDDHSALVGAKILRIGDVSAASAYALIRTMVGRDNEQGARFFVPNLMVMPEVLSALGIAASEDSVRVEIERDGVRRVAWLRAPGPIDMMTADTDRSWRHRAGWVDARDTSRAREPLWLRDDPDSTLRLTVLPRSNAVYARINKVGDARSETLDRFAARLFRTVDSVRADKLIIDLRMNRGGDGTLLKPLEIGAVKSRTNHPGGLIVLTSRSTWSAAQFFLDFLESYTDAVFIGEPSASRGNAYGDSRKITLPHSGITVRASVFWWQDWHPLDDRPWIAPTVDVQPTFADYRANRDPVLDAALRYTALPPERHTAP